MQLFNSGDSSHGADHSRQAALGLVRRHAGRLPSHSKLDFRVSDGVTHTHTHHASHLLEGGACLTSPDFPHQKELVLDCAFKFSHYKLLSVLVKVCLALFNQTLGEKKQHALL